MATRRSTAARASAALAELRTLGFTGPFRGSRMCGPVVLEVRRRNSRIHIAGIWVSPEARGQGAGAVALALITAAADRHRVACELRVCPFDGKPVKTRDLRAWYERYGFEREPRSALMVRRPGAVT
jgi:GNAT superfamily N-acetyltransferase